MMYWDVKKIILGIKGLTRQGFTIVEINHFYQPSINMNWSLQFGNVLKEMFFFPIHSFCLPCENSKVSQISEEDAFIA